MCPVLFCAMLAEVNLGPMSPNAPARQPQLAVRGSTVALAFGAGGAVYFSESRDSGRSFAPPVKVAEAAILPLTRHRGPRIAFAGDAIVITAVAGRTPAEGQHAHGLPSDGDLTAWRSLDGGKTWSGGTVVNDASGAATEGLHALAADAKGNLFAAWLDKRGGLGTRLYGARSTDRGRTWSVNILIYASPDGSICECCHPSVAMVGAREVVVMWRNSLAGARDMYMVRSTDGVKFSRPEKLGTGTWKLNACPMDGGGLAIAQNRAVAVWRREHEIFLERLGEPEIPIGEGADVAIAADSRGVYAIWSTGAGLQAWLPGAKQAAPLGTKGSFPNIVALPEGQALAAWEDDGRIVIRRVP
jgi:hypothetical protein